MVLREVPTLTQAAFSSTLEGEHTLISVISELVVMKENRGEVEKGNQFQKESQKSKFGRGK